MMGQKIANGLSRSVQDYLKTIYNLTRSGEPLGTMELAEAMHVKPASVSNMLQKLDAHAPRLVEYHKHRGVSLTPEGEQAALKIIRRHRLIEQFLYQVLGYSWDKVHQDAEELEHAVSPYLEDRIASLLGEPRFDPHGEPIPSRALELADDPDIVQLNVIGEGQAGVVRRLDSRKDEFFDYYIQIGLKLGVVIKVLQRNPLDGTQRIQLEDQAEAYVIGPEIATAILVEPL